MASRSAATGAQTGLTMEIVVNYMRAGTTGVAGYWLVTADGGVFTFGNARFHGSLPALGIATDIVGMAALADGSGYWLVAGDGGVFAFGAAQFWGSLSGAGATAPIVGMAACADGSGYWLVGEDGGVFAFGGANYHGSLPGSGVDASAVGLAALADGSGYYVLADEGTVYAFGAALYHGAPNGRRALTRTVAMATLPDGSGYWVLGQGGEVSTFGAAPDHGALPADAAIGAATISAAGREGYLLVSGEGRVLPFGVASFHGSMPYSPSGARVVASAIVRSPAVLGSRATRLLEHLQPPSDNGHATGRAALPFGGINFPPCDTPRVSIVIPVHGQSHFTVGCLHSIAAASGVVPFEVIVVDDDSPDDTASLLASVGNVKVVVNEANLGFTKSCNAGIAAASGEYVVLLNNDTEVMPGWLDELTRTADDDAGIGVVGAQLLYQDGTLQEAGGIIWRDGSGMNYGRADRADRAEYNYQREVDYCSGACLLVRRDLLKRLGGLDERYAPAYYEDTDLAFAARSLGYKVVYQPRSRVIHHEGGSHGTDESAGIKRYQSVNRHIFVDKWAKELEAQYPPDPSNVLLARDSRRGPRALIVDHMVPHYDQDSGSVRMFALLAILVDLGFSVTFLPANQAAIQPYTARLQQMGVEVLYGPVEIGPHIQSMGRQLTLCVLSRPSVACQFIGAVRAFAPWTTLIYDTVDLHFLRERRYGEVNRDVGTIEASKATREIELALVRAADLTLTVSPEERRILLDEVPDATVSVVPNIHEVHHASANPEPRRGLLFVGSFCHDPNRDSVLHLVRDIMPLLRLELPGVRLTIVGSNPTPDVLALASADVEVLGWVEDLEPLFEQARVFVAPLRFGAGMKGKIGESLSYGVPTVTSVVGAEGMGLVPEEHVLLGDDPATFAAQVIRLHNDPELWTHISEQGRAHVAEHYRPAAVREQVRALLVSVGALPIPSPPS